MAGVVPMQSMVMPATTSMYAAPQYASASVYGAAPASLYAPASTVVAAPTVAAASYVAPPVTTVAAPVAAASYVAPAAAAVSVAAAPVAAAPSFVAPQFYMPEPVSMTAGLPGPDQLEKEKKAYEVALAAQLDKQSKAVLEESKIKQQMLQQAAKTQIAQFTITTEEQCKIACLQVEQEANQMVNGLKEAAILQQTSVEERAAVAVADFNKKRALEEMAKKSYALQKQWFDGEAKLTYDYQKALAAGSAGNRVMAGAASVGAVPVAAPTAYYPPQTTANPVTFAAAPAAAYAAPVTYAAAPTTAYAAPATYAAPVAATVL